MAAVRRNQTVVFGDARAVLEAYDKQISGHLSNYDKVMMPNYLGGVTNQKLLEMLPPSQHGKWGPIFSSDEPQNIEKRRQFVAMYNGMNKFGDDQVTVLGIDDDVMAALRLNQNEAFQAKLNGLNVSKHMETYKEKLAPQERNDMIEAMARDGVMSRDDPMYKPNTKVGVSDKALWDSFDPKRMKDYVANLELPIMSYRIEREVEDGSLDKGVEQDVVFSLGKNSELIEPMLKGEKSGFEQGSTALSIEREKARKKQWDIDNAKAKAAQIEAQKKEKTGQMVAAKKSAPEVELMGEDEVVPKGRGRGRGVDIGDLGGGPQ